MESSVTEIVAIVRHFWSFFCTLATQVHESLYFCFRWDGQICRRVSMSFISVNDQWASIASTRSVWYVFVAERTLTGAQCPVSGLMYATVSSHHQHCTYRFLTTTSSTDAAAADDVDGDSRVTQCLNASQVAAKCISQGITNTPHLQVNIIYLLNSRKQALNWATTVQPTENCLTLSWSQGTMLLYRLKSCLYTAELGKTEKVQMFNYWPVLLADTLSYLFASLCSEAK